MSTVRKVQYIEVDRDKYYEYNNARGVDKMRLHRELFYSGAPPLQTGSIVDVPDKGVQEKRGAIVVKQRRWTLSETPQLAPHPLLSSEIERA